MMGKNMPEELLVRHHSPSLIGAKTGNMFTRTFADIIEMRSCVRCVKQMLVKRGLRVLPLRFREYQELVYVYRPS